MLLHFAMLCCVNLCFRANQHLRSLAPTPNDLWWLWWPMISGDGWGLSFPDNCLTVEEKTPDKTSPRKTDPTGNRTRTRCVRGNDVSHRPQSCSPFYTPCCNDKSSHTDSALSHCFALGIRTIGGLLTCLAWARLFLTSAGFTMCNHSPNFLDAPRMCKF